MFDTNLQGNIEYYLRISDNMTILPKEFIYFSTVSVYGLEYGKNITEDFSTEPSDPYGESKLLAEGAVVAWCKKNNIRFLVLRIPLVIGRNPPGNLKKMIEGIKIGRYVSLGSGKVRKSMVLVEDLAILVSKPISHSGIYNLTDDINPTFREIENIIAKHFNRRIVSIPIF
ncbi:MAG: NAD-dependent epimerase/dehydratase family protein [Cytophagaceae bacterium]|nr:NAD-dependent epimerase/dehydratase family protein [Cytophagaceae bacterium]